MNTQEEIKLLKKKKLLLEMKKEINKLETQLKYIKLINLKIKAIKNLKISLKVSQAAAPYILCCSIIAGTFKLTGLGLPFYNGDKFNHISQKMKEFDNLGNIRYEQQYQPFENDENVLYYHTNWQPSDEQFYSRDIQTYKLGELKEEDILKLFNLQEQELNDILGDPIKISKEISNNIEKELSTDIYFQAVIYSTDSNDYITEKETNLQNIIITILYIFITTIPCFGISGFRYFFSSFNLKNEIYKIKFQYKPLYEENIKMKLEIKKDNYNRLTR